MPCRDVENVTNFGRDIDVTGQEGGPDNMWVSDSTINK